MKKILILGLFMILGCNEKSKNELPKKIEIDSTNNGNVVSKNETIKNIITEEKVLTTDILGHSFLGKTSIDIERFNIYVCFGVLISNENEKFGVTKYSKVIDDCMNGKSKIVLQKFLNYYDGGKANFEVVDEMNIRSDYPKKYYNTIPLKLNNDKEEQSYLIEYEDNSKETLTKIFKIWKLDLENQKFVEIEVPKNFTCNNPEYAEE